MVPRLLGEIRIANGSGRGESQQIALAARTSHDTARFYSPSLRARADWRHCRPL
jgi:hypothetical protein